MLDNDQAGERQTLLIPDNDSKPTSKSSTRRLSRLFPTIHVTEPRFRFLPLLGCFLVFLGDGEYYFKEVGYWRALESLYCLEYYQKVDPEIAKLGRHIPESMCKLDPVGRKVATALGITTLIRFVSCFVGTMPLGYAADRVGRRFALVMNRVGTTFYTAVVLATYLGYPQVPIWVAFLGGLGGLIGANIDLHLSVMLAAYTDAMTDKSQRESCYYATSAMQFVAQVVWPLIAGASMNLDGQGGTPVVSLWISFVMAVSGLLIVASLWPETLRKREAQTPVNDDDDEVLVSTSEAGLIAAVRAKMAASWNNFEGSIRLLGKVDLTLLILAGLLVSAAAKVVCWLGVIQYPVLRFRWKYGQSTMLMTVQAVVYILLYFTILPGLRRIGKRVGLTHSSTSLLIMLGSAGMLEAGGILLWLAAHASAFIAATCIFTLGAALPDVIKAFLADRIDRSHLGVVLGVFSLAIVGGKMVAAAVGPAILNAGIVSSIELFRGEVFLFASILGLVATFALIAIATRAAPGMHPENNGEVEA